MKFQGKKVYFGLLRKSGKDPRGHLSQRQKETSKRLPHHCHNQQQKQTVSEIQAESASSCWYQRWWRNWTWNFQFKPELLEWSQSDPNSMTTRVSRKWLIYRFPSISDNSITLHNNKMFKDLKDGGPRTNMIEVITKREQADKTEVISIDIIINITDTLNT